MLRIFDFDVLVSNNDEMASVCDTIPEASVGESPVSDGVPVL